jgi:hypothetical protein
MINIISFCNFNLTSTNWFKPKYCQDAYSSRFLNVSGLINPGAFGDIGCVSTSSKVKVVFICEFICCQWLNESELKFRAVIGRNLELDGLCVAPEIQGEQKQIYFIMDLPDASSATNSRPLVVMTLPDPSKMTRHGIPSTPYFSPNV